MKKHNLAQKGKRALSMLLVALMVLSCWVWVEPNQLIAEAANETEKNKFLFAYFTGTSKEGQTIHLAVSEDGYNYTALRNNEPVIIPSKGVGNVRDPYIWYNEQDNYYYILATDLDFTDGGGTYSNNSQSFIIWRSKDLVNWYDETFIDVSKMAHLIGDTRNMSAVWAPQVLWDGSAYVVYFTLACNATSWFDIVYLKTTDLLDPNAYYEFDYILGNGTGNGTDNGYGVIDADIIHNPGDGKYYLFYKTECNANELGTTNKGTSLKTIHYYVGDTPTGPFTNPGDTKWSNAGFSIFPNYNVSLEGCNSFFDNDGNLIMYADEFEHTNANGEAEAYFHIAKSNGYDFTSWSYPDVSQHNINSLSPRHGSVVKITEAEYNRLLNNSYNITSSSYPDTEVLEDHLVARYFTTADVNWNAVIGQPNLASSTGITMVDDTSIGYYASFDSTNGGWAEVDFDSLFRKTNGLNYEDGFTITFSAMLQPNSSTNNENNDRIYEIADVFGSRTGTEHYTHFSPGGGGNGSYLGNYNGPVDSGNDWLNDKDGANRDDECFHEYIISYATGNVMVYVDGQLVISRNRFTGVKLDDSWYKALGSNATMRIGRSGWDADPLFKGRIQNLCIYDCSMSYYDAQSMNDDYKENLGWVEKISYNTSTKVPTFANGNESQMSTYNNDRGNGYPYNPSEHYGNILYTTPVTGTPSGSGSGANPDAGVSVLDTHDFGTNGNFNVGIYYANTTVLLYDGRNPARMPVMLAGRIDTNNYGAYLNAVYPTENTGTNNENNALKLEHTWRGWTSSDKYWDTVQNPDGATYHIGYNPSTTGYKPYFDEGNSQSARSVWYFASTLAVDGENIDFGGAGYKKYNLPWRLIGEGGSDKFDTVKSSDKDHNIYVINFKPILDLRDTITEDMYNEVMNNSALCPELREKYAAAVYAIRTMDPNNYGFAAAPVTATKACAKAISEAVGTYNGVMAEIEREAGEGGTYGHQCTELSAREATCSKNGLTAGSYCVLCGEILEEQQVIAPLPHTFGATFTENGVQYKQCSVCGVKIEYQASGVRYENLFSLNGWMDSLSYNNGNGISGGATLSASSANGTITINNTNTGEAVTSTSGGTNRDGTWDCYCIPVKGNGTYVVEFTVTGVQGEIHVFKYDINGNLTGSYGDTPVSGTNGTFSKEFTVDSTTAYIELRFDCNAQGTTTFSQIGVYSKESFDTFAETTADARLGFYPGESEVLCFPNPAAGYTFDGWYTRSGVKIDNVNQLNNPTTVVYGKWIKAGYNVVYDSIFSFSDWAKSSSNQLWYGDIYNLNDDGSRGEFIGNANGGRMVSKEGILADAENGTISITWDANNKTYADTENKKYIQYCARTNLHIDSGNLHTIPVEKNTEYIIEYTASSDDGGKPNICAYMPGTGVTGMDAQESGSITRYGLGTQYFRINTYAATGLTLRFDNVQIGSTVTYSDIAVYKADFEEAARTIENRQYRRYYPTEMGIGNVFEYTPTRPGYTFSTWKADTNGDNVGDFEMKGFDDTFLVEQNWHLFSEWTENTYNIVYDDNGGTGSVTSQNVTYTEDVTLASSGFTKPGHKLLGWSTVSNATSAMYQLGQTTNRLCEDNNGTITLYAVWEATNVVVTFDNMFDYSQFNIGTGSLTIDERTDTGFTVTSTGNDANTGFSYAIPVEPGKTYKFSADVEIERADGDTKGYDMYINTLDSNQVGEATSTVDTSNGAHKEGDIYISLTGQMNSNKNSYIKFTAGVDTEYIKVRFDANTPGNKLTVNNIRIEDTSITHTETSRTIEYGTAFGELPTPTRAGYIFKHWEDKNGDEVTKDTLVSDANMRLTSVWEQVFYTINFSANGPADLSIPNTSLVEGKDTITLPAALEYEDLEFVGWSLNQFQDPYNDEGIYDASEQVNVNEITNWEEDANKVKVTEFCAVWKLNDTAVKDDTVVADFNQPIKISPYEMNDSGVVLYHAGGMCNSWSIDLPNGGTGNYGTFAIDGAYITYTPTKIINGVDEVDVQLTLNYPSQSRTFTSTITVAPASNMLYEEDVLNITANDSTVDWNKTSGSKTTTQDLYHNKEGIYGYDDHYKNSSAFSDGSHLKADVTPSNKMSDTATFEFVGSGFDLISACGTNTGVQRVRIYKGSGSSKTLYGMYVVDTYFSDTSIMNDGLLHQVPVLQFRDDYGTYTVETTAVYLSSAGALKAQASAAYSKGTTTTSEGIKIETNSTSATDEMLKELGIEDVDCPVEFIWMDDNSVLNGGTGAKKALLSGFAGLFFAGDGTTTTSTGLENYIDGVRIYNPLKGGSDYYKDSEQNPTYFNIVEELEWDSSESNMAYIEGSSLNFGEISLDPEDADKYNFNAYHENGGPKGEIYLKEGDAIAFKFKAESNGTASGIMLGMRAVKGNPTANTTVGDIDGNVTVNSATEMYYEIATNVKVTTDGVTVIVTNPDDGKSDTNNILAVNNLKLVNGPQNAADQVDNGLILGNTSTAPLAPTPVIPDSVQGDAGNAEDISETDVDTETNVPETDAETEVEEETENNISVAIPGLPAPIASFLEMLFKFLGQLVGSLGF